MRPFARVPGPSRRAGVAVTILLLALTAAVPAQADTLFGITGGYFAVKSESSRDTDDVIYQNRGFLAFDVSDFNGGTIGGEFLVGAGRFVEVGVGVGYYQQSVPSFDLDFTAPSGRELEQRTDLRIVPVSAMARVFPLGRDQGVQPYIGGGVALLNWKYTEDGEFVDDNTREIIAGRFTDDGNVVGPLVMAGVRFALSDAVMLGGEVRYQGGKADLDPSQGFAGDRLDLGGYSTQVTLHVRFD